MKIDFPLFAQLDLYTYTGVYMPKYSGPADVHLRSTWGSYRSFEANDPYFSQPGHGKENMVIHAKLNAAWMSGSSYYLDLDEFTSEMHLDPESGYFTTTWGYDYLKDPTLEFGKARRQYLGTNYVWKHDHKLYKVTLNRYIDNNGEVSSCFANGQYLPLVDHVEGSPDYYGTYRWGPMIVHYHNSVELPRHITASEVKRHFELLLDYDYSTQERQYAVRDLSVYYLRFPSDFKFTPSKSCNPRDLFKFSEWALDVGYSYPFLRNYTVQKGRQDAFLDAADHFPKLNDNMISNIIEAVKFIAGLCKGKISLPKNPQQAWLSYRYSYSTTKLDMSEAIDYVDQLSNRKGNVFQSYGYYRQDDAIFRCKIKAHSRVLSSFDNIKKYLNEYGLEFDPYVLWDMIPYSFMIDWALPIGDILGLISHRKDYSQSFYDFDYLIYSVTYDSKNNGATGHCYTRWIEGVPPALVGYYELGNNPSSKTKIKRAFDAFALFT